MIFIHIRNYFIDLTVDDDVNVDDDVDNNNDCCCCYLTVTINYENDDY